MHLSVKKHINGCVMLTGGVGFLGSVCLEQLLSLTEVQKVFMLVRSKRNLSAQDRVQRLLCGPLFNKLHKQALSGGLNVFGKVQVVEGDLEKPDMGLSEADRNLLASEVDVIIHSAASLNLDAHIQQLLRSNFHGTQQLLGLAREMQHLRSFVYLSTYYVNCFKPYNTPVREAVHYPTLQLTGDPKALSYAQLGELLLSLPADKAAAEAAGIMDRLNLASTYTFSKLLTEQMVDDSNSLPGVSKAIVRPSLISNMLAGPYPGFVSGFAGVPGYCIAYAIGFFHDIGSVAFASDAVLDLIPVDVTAALVIAAAAAAAAAHGPYACSRARVYHATSADSYPEGAPSFFKNLNKFWSANPPPFRLPFANYPTFSGRHQSTEESLKAGRIKTGAKVWAAARLLQLTGNGRKAHTLVQGFKAFCVQNSLRYARSIVSRVDNARLLQRSLVPEERQNWPCVWEKGPGMDWEAYTWTSLAALRTMALRLPASEVAGVEHQFVPLQGLAEASLMSQWLAAGPAATASSNVDSVPRLATVSTAPSSVSVAADSPLSASSSSLHSARSSLVSVWGDSSGYEGDSDSDYSSAGHDLKPWGRPLPPLEGGVQLKRSQSCQAVLINTYYHAE